MTTEQQKKPTVLTRLKSSEEIWSENDFSSMES
jgi:hypothetical protein